MVLEIIEPTFFSGAFSIHQTKIREKGKKTISLNGKRDVSAKKEKEGEEVKYRWC